MNFHERLFLLEIYSSETVCLKQTAINHQDQQFSFEE